MATSNRGDDTSDPMVAPLLADHVLAAAARANPTPMAVCGPRGHVLWANDAFAASVAMASAELMGRPLAELTASVTAHRRFVTTPIPADPEQRVLVSTESSPAAAPVAAPPGLAEAVPELLGRAAFLHALEERLAGPGSAALVLVAVDRFMTFADALGPIEGDRLLVVMATRLRDAMGQGHVICHLGADQFAFLAPDEWRRERVVEAADRAIGAVAEPVDVGDVAVAVSVSIGIAFAPGGTTPATALGEADGALAAARRGGGNMRVVFDDALRTRLVQRSRLEGELRVALAGGRLEVHFQPEVDMVSGGMRGVEALVRWPHPRHGLLAADAFIGLAEDAGLAADLGRWVLGEACRQAALVVPHADLEMRVNVSALHLADPRLVDDVREALASTGLGPDRLCLEITETAVMTDISRSMAVLDALYHLGVRIAIDDFGTGFSSLAHLKRFPVQIVKVDRSFVDDVATSPDGRAIVASIVGLASSLALEVVAEGVETEAQREVLVGLGVRRAQGHLFAPALPADELVGWAAERS